MMLDMAMRNAAVGAAIARARKEKGWKQRQLAAQIPGRDGPINTQTVSNWERGRHQPDLETLEVIASALEKPLSYFLGDEREPEEELPPTLQEELAAAVRVLAEVVPRFESIAGRLEALVDEQEQAPGDPQPGQDG